MATPPWELNGLSEEQANADFQTFMNGGLAPGEHIPMQGDGFTPTDPNSAIGAALAAADQPTPVSGGPVPDIADQQTQAPVWTPPAEVPPTSLTQAPPLELRSVSSSQGGTYHTLPPPPQAGKGSGPTPPDPSWVLDQTVGHADEGNGATGVYRQAQGYATERDAQLGIDATNEQAAVEEANLAANNLTDANVEVARRNRNLKLAQQAQVDAELRIRDIDPAHVWSTKDGGQKAAALVSAFIGGFLSPYNGGKNGALDQISQMIDDDIRAQEQNQATARFMLGRADTALDKAEQGVQLSREEKRMACAKDIAARLKQEQAKYQSVFTQAKFQDKIGLLERYVGEQSAAIGQKAYEQADARDRFEKDYNLRRWAQSEVARNNKAQISLQRERLAAEAAKKDAQNPPMVVFSAMAPGNKYKVDPLRAANMKGTELQDFDKIQQKSGEISQIAKEFFDATTKSGEFFNGLGAGSVLNSAKRQEAVQYHDMLVEKVLFSITGAAAPTEQMRRVAEGIVGSVDDMIHMSPEANIARLSKLYGKQVELAARSLNLTKVDDNGNQILDKNGKPIPWSLDAEGFTFPKKTSDEVKAQPIAEFTADIRGLGPDTPITSWDASTRLLSERTADAVRNPGQAVNYLGALFEAAGRAPTQEIQNRFLEEAHNVEARLRVQDLTRSATGPRLPSLPFVLGGPSNGSGVPLFDRAQMSSDDILKNATATSGDAWLGQMQYNRSKNR